MEAIEVYSPARVLPLVPFGPLGPCRLSLDIITGWNFLDSSLKRSLLSWLESPNSAQLSSILLSPPCTVFSPLQKCFRNFEKMPRQLVEQKWGEGMGHLEFSMGIAESSVRRPRTFMFEHPQRASSWKQECVQRVENLEGVGSVCFDQCMLGLRAPNKKLMKKRTKILSNNQWLLRTLQNFQCDRSHEHQHIIGSMNGRSLSWWAQHYPDDMCRILAESVRKI